MIRLKAFLLFSVVAILATMVHPAHASGTVLRANCSAPYAYQNSTNSTGYTYSTPTLACGAGGGTSTGGDACYGTCSAQVPSHYYSVNYPAACPANSTGTTSCVCNAGFVPNAGATACVAAVACPANGTLITSGYFDLGTDPNTSADRPPLHPCNNSCDVGYNGAALGWRALVSGIWHYFSLGSYAYTGQTCVGGTSSVGSVTALPTSSCGTGQSLVTGAGGFSKCYNDSTGLVSDSNSSSAVASAKTLADLATASAVAAAGTAASAAGLSASGVADAKAMAAALSASGGGTAPLANLPPSDPLQGFCKTNPTADICKAQTVQAKAAGALPSTGTGSWYTKTYPQGVGGVLTANFNTLKVTPLAGLINGLVPTFSGAAHNGCFSIEIWHMGTQSICVPPLVMSALGVFMILTALFAARGIVFGG